MTHCDEYWDITDEDGTPTGELHRRGSSPWPEGRFHLAATICLVRSDHTILLSQRAANKEFPLDWEFPGGCVVAGETSLDAAVRELCEEVGVNVHRDSLILVGRSVEGSTLVDLYLARLSDSIVVSPDLKEVQTCEWVAFEEAKRRLLTSAMAAPWEAGLGTLWDALESAFEAFRQ